MPRVESYTFPGCGEPIDKPVSNEPLKNSREINGMPVIGQVVHPIEAPIEVTRRPDETDEELHDRRMVIGLQRGIDLYHKTHGPGLV